MTTPDEIILSETFKKMYDEIKFAIAHPESPSALRMNENLKNCIKHGKSVLCQDNKNFLLPRQKNSDIILERWKGVKFMGEYRKLDFSKLNFSDSKISFEEAVKDTTPFELSNEIISGEKKIKITKAEKEYENRCVKLEISC